jgi:2-polyprenyl-3-methyl-5-hydroxy-6-metoxy-1,4-benzoquinol methylase
MRNDDLGEKLSEDELCPEELLKGQEEAFQRDVDRLVAQRQGFVSVACPACGGTGGDPTFEKYGFQYTRCHDCRTIWMNPRPPEPMMAGYYANSENYQYWAKYIFPASEASRREKLHKPRLQRIVEYCGRFGSGRDTLVEVGPGFGTFSSVAMESGKFKKVLAVEPTPELAVACRDRGVTVIEKRIEDVTGEVFGIDVLASFEVIEHLFAPRDFISKGFRLLKPGGMLVLSCPNGEGFEIAQLGPVALAVDPEHQNLFNPASLSLLVESCGFEVVDVSTPGRLDAEFVREAALAGKIDLDAQPFLKAVLLDEWERLGWTFQKFLAENGLSAHMWLVALKPA